MCKEVKEVIVEMASSNSVFWGVFLVLMTGLFVWLYREATRP